METRAIRFKHALIIGLLVAESTMLFSCAGGSAYHCDSIHRTSKTKKWYVGGTLHDKTVANWRAATYENRLATCADFVIKLGKYQSLPLDLKKRAVELEACISKAVEGGSVDKKPLSEIATTCAVLLGY